MIFSYTELILSDSENLIDSFKDNLKQNSNVTTSYNNFNSNYCYNLAIIDNKIKNLPNQLYRIKNIINLTNINLREDEIKFKKPIKLAQILDLILHHRQNKQIFCAVTNNWIYDEQLKRLSGLKDKIKFTERENLLFKFLMINQNNNISRSDILTSLFKKLPWISTNNLDVYFHRLKNKLPLESHEILKLQKTLQ